MRGRSFTLPGLRVQLDIFLNVAVGGILTGLVYGLMALGLSVIFGVVRVVNFAHGEMMTMAMYTAVTLFGACDRRLGDRRADSLFGRPFFCSYHTRPPSGCSPRIPSKVRAELLGLGL